MMRRTGFRRTPFAGFARGDRGLGNDNSGKSNFVAASQGHWQQCLCYRRLEAGATK